ncbi:SO2930 family diheme c-type cytochrome [Pelomonas sp. KK5]|uniref:SO2930 family diheme c-type cytochrome n=1 Tax=Pelomonas sp. KK5 TaxID=1855730 RepID=UPI00097C7D99|nr:SO2930 family diheme c-type cytochrome [Pelomonas sp. KK5]
MYNVVTLWRAAGALVLGAALAASLTACKNTNAPAAFIPEGQPARLSDWHQFRTGALRVELNEGVQPYELNTPLFSDYAHKLRTIWMPAGTPPGKYAPEAAFELPVGTVITKTFYYPKADGALLQTATSSSNADLLDGRTLDLSRVRLIETRVLVHRTEGWVALPYVWNAEQTEAVLSRTGDEAALTLKDEKSGASHSFTYVVPNTNQCASCHVAKIKGKELQPIGLKARHLNRPFTYAGGATENQLEHLVKAGFLTGLPAEAATIPKNADWRDPALPLEARARAYLDINCAHCHNPVGAANNTGLNLEPFLPPNRVLGLCKPPVAAGKGTGDRGFGIVPGQPDASIMPFRLSSTEGGIMMPELGRSTVHEEGLKLIRDWIKAMPGQCVPTDKT